MLVSCLFRKHLHLIVVFSPAVIMFTVPFFQFQCSVSCGQGKAMRQVVCVDFLGLTVEQNECDPEDIPSSEQECSMSPCHYVNNDYGRPIHYLPNVDQRVRSNPTLAILNRNSGRSIGSGGNQWRIGPWGSVSSNSLLCISSG